MKANRHRNGCQINKLALILTLIDAYISNHDQLPKSQKTA